MFCVVTLFIFFLFYISAGRSRVFLVVVVTAFVSVVAVTAYFSRRQIKCISETNKHKHVVVSSAIRLTYYSTSFNRSIKATKWPKPTITIPGVQRRVGVNGPESIGDLPFLALLDPDSQVGGSNQQPQEDTWPSSTETHHKVTSINGVWFKLRPQVKTQVLYQKKHSVQNLDI